MEGDLEIRPRAACAECGRKVAPAVGPSFVYGIGAVGFQHSAACGARWRCMWRPPRRRLMSLRSLVVVGVVLLALAVGAVAYASSRSSDEPELASATRGASPSASERPQPSATGARYVAIVTPGNGAKAELRDFLHAAPPATPASELNRHVAAYAAAAQRTRAALRTTRWPKAGTAAVQQLIAADATYVTDLTQGVGRLNERQFGAQLQADATAVRAAANRARAALGLRSLGAAPDPRFPPL